MTNEELLRAIALNSHPDSYSELLNEALRRMQPTDNPNLNDLTHEQLFDLLDDALERVGALRCALHGSKESVK